MRVGSVSGREHSSLEPEQLGLREALAALLDVVLAGPEHVERLPPVACGEAKVGEQDVEMGQAEPGPGGEVGGEALLHLRRSALELSGTPA